jgi:LDH2 family malate/lactate/ureidoglycolate dehydrogenase
VRIDVPTFRRTVGQILLAGGVDPSQAESVRDNLVWCDMAGRRNHGIERLPILLERVARGGIAAPCTPRFERLGPALANLDAGNGFGQHAGRLAVDRACDLATKYGVGIVGVHNSNFFGAGGYYVERAAERGMIGLALSNSFPKVAAAGGLRPALGTNPLAFAAPRSNGRALIIDMSTAALAGSTVREAIAKGERLGKDVAIDADGRPITDPALVERGTLLPAAGAKGFGLALMVELLSSVLTGAAVSREVGSMYKHVSAGGNNGHFFLALDIGRWVPRAEWDERLEGLCLALLGSGLPGAVRIPGDVRWSEYDRSLADGVLIENHTLERTEALASELGVEFGWRESVG